MLNNKKIAFVTTTFKRIDYFKKMIDSLYLCEDFNLIDEIYILDDGSSQKDLSEMKKLLPQANIIFNNYQNQPMNLNTIFDIKCDYLMLIEDDVEFIKRNNYIEKSIKIIENSDYSQIIFSCFNQHYHGIDKNICGIDIKEYVFNPDNYLLKKHIENIGLGPFCGNPNNWPKFYLIASMINLNKIKSYNERFKDEHHFERKFGWRISEKGFKSASLPICCRHIGELSTYGHFTNRSK
jgi:hypothetical protein